MTTPSSELRGEHNLKCCPFCSGSKISFDTDDVEFDITRATCGDCGAAGPFVDLSDHPTVQAAEVRAADFWNTRDGDGWS